MLKLHGPGSRRRVCVVLALLALPALAAATTWHVTFDPVQPEDRVGAIAAQAASGDSILIDPGTYYEHIPLEGKSLTFIGLGGAGVTILDGSRDLPGREGSIIYTLTGAAEDLTVEGLTLRGGTGTPWSESVYDVIGGGAISWWEERPTGTAKLLLVDCVFEHNSTGDPDELLAVGGGALFAYRLGDIRLERCSFSDNASAVAGGDICLHGQTASVVQCAFHIAHRSWDGGSSIELTDGSLTILGCTFESDMILDGWWPAIWATPSRIEILDSQFIDRGTPLATGVFLGFYGGGSPRQEVVIARNLFWNACAPDSAAPASVDIAMPNGAYEIRENTFVGCGVDIQTNSGAPEMVFERNIVAGGEAKFFMPPGGDVRCCDFWRTTVVDYIGNLTLSDNISTDPLFCDEQAGDLRIAFQSPCAPENSPGGCGRIGALDPACDLTPARRMSWGSIKAVFRGER